MRGTGEIADRIVDGCTCAMATPLDSGSCDTSFSMFFAIFADELRGVSVPGPGTSEVGGAILVTEGVTANDDGIGPARHEARDIVDDDRLAENHAAKDVADRAVGRAPHLLEVEFFDALLHRE